MQKDTNFNEGLYLKTFGNRLKKLLKMTKTTQKELAQEIGVTPKTVTSWTKGRLQPTLISFIKIVLFFRYKLNRKGNRILPLKILTPEIINNEMEYLKQWFFEELLDYYTFKKR